MGHSRKEKFSGSKNKRKFKHDAKKIKKKSDRKVAVQIPKTSKECGSNWKILLKELKETKEEKQSVTVSHNITKSNKNVKSKRKMSKNKHDAKNKTKKQNSNQSSEKIGDAEIWFDDIPKEEILAAEQDASINKSGTKSTDSVLVKEGAFSGLTKAVGLDCEMVGTGYNGSSSILARVSIVNQYGKCIYDKHVKAGEKVTDYRTWVSGIRPSDLKGAEDFGTVQREVAEILKGRVLVGHSLHNDLKVLYLSHPKRFIRDTAEYKPFRAHNNGRAPALRVLSSRILNIQVQKGEHSSVQDAQAAMKLYMMHKKQWEKELRLSKMGNK